MCIRDREKYARPEVCTKKVLIAGGGIAGMEAAITAARRGHEVVLCEKSGELGGVLLCEKNVPFKKHLHEYIELQKRTVAKLPIRVMLDTEVNARVAEEHSPDVIIAATGARPSVPPIPGIDGDNVKTAEEVYINPNLAGESVLILGGGLVGTELAVYLAGLGKKVQIVEMAERLNDGGNILQGQSIGLEIRRLGISVSLGTKAVSYTHLGRFHIRTLRCNGHRFRTSRQRYRQS